MLDATRWIAQENPLAARGLGDAVRRAAQRIGDHPEIGSLRPDLAALDYRFVALSGYPYVVVDNAGRTPPRIVRILHGARDVRALLRGP